MLYLNFFRFLFFVIFLSCFQSDVFALENFDELHIKDAAYYAKHSYLVADEFLASAGDARRIERRIPIKGEETRPFVGETGGLFILSPHSHAIGSVYRRENDNRIFIAFHGSHFLADWVTDFKATKRNALDTHGFDGMVHSGFSQVAESSYNSMVRQIRATLGDTPVVNCEFIFCGHSLGAAVSTIAARQFSILLGRHMNNEGVSQEFLPEGFDRRKIKLITISSPRVGDDTFASTFSTYVPFTLRFYHRGDIVEKVPPTELFGFKHVGTEIEFIFGETTVSKLSKIQGLFEFFPDGRSIVAAAASLLYRPKEKVGAAAVALMSIPIKMMHMVPDEDVIMRAYLYERQYIGDPSYKGVSQFDLRRNDFLRTAARWFI